ncbi:unnamed protein product (macronuclear) [Paramecium tetraurelia]|uniref:Uncharacterized protein n=1 Tax=Paramecium tetraurelia TaxID=5888 RepID=A0DZG1_PARTE|nr:uncharacterized protein GSPATT00021595001 [Paramecium tetraurelia]CAK88428.1 unnamed protein product [Paramecium tetraurelia]|eukprot:XP_001455825.1 hypothetical protein (macronuclear) [Paramecium tetraurelia strain d4-2]
MRMQIQVLPWHIQLQQKVLSIQTIFLQQLFKQSIDFLKLYQKQSYQQKFTKKCKYKPPNDMTSYVITIVRSNPINAVLTPQHHLQIIPKIPPTKVKKIFGNANPEYSNLNYEMVMTNYSIN